MMKKYNISIMALLLFFAGIVIFYLTQHVDSSIDTDLAGFFAGICVGAGASIFIYSIVLNIKNNKKSKEDTAEAEE